MRSATEQGAPRELLAREAGRLTVHEHGDQAGGDPEGEPVRHGLGERPGLGGDCGDARGFQGAAGLPPVRAI